MRFEDCLIEAIDVVLAQEIPDEVFAAAVQTQACLMAGINPEEIRESYSD